MANNYYTFSPDFVPGQKVRSDEMNLQLSAIEVAFDLMPTDNSAISRGTTFLGTESGGVNTVEIALADPRTSYQDGDQVSWKSSTTNTGASTIDIDGVGAVSLVAADGSPLLAGEISTGLFYTAIFDLTNNRWQMLGASAAALAAADDRVSWAEEWAIQVEDTPVSTDAGGDGISDFSALHWAAKASDSAAAALVSEGNAATSETNAAASAASINLPTIVGGDAGKHLKVNVGETGYDLYDIFGTANTWSAQQTYDDTSIRMDRDTSTFAAVFLQFRDTGLPITRFELLLDGVTHDVVMQGNGSAELLRMAQDAKTLETTSTQLLFNSIDVQREATETTTGLVERATQAEVDTGTDTTRYVTPDTLHDKAKLKVNTEAYYASEVDNGNSGTADTIDWTAGNKQKSTLTGNCTYTFTAPSGPTNLILRCIQDGTGTRGAIWPGTVNWPGGVAPPLTTTAGAVDVISLYFDGTDYHGSYLLDSK